MINYSTLPVFLLLYAVFFALNQIPYSANYPTEPMTGCPRADIWPVASELEIVNRRDTTSSGKLGSVSSITVVHKAFHHCHQKIERSALQSRKSGGGWQRQTKQISWWSDAARDREGQCCLMRNTGLNKRNCESFCAAKWMPCWDIAIYTACGIC